MVAAATAMLRPTASMAQVSGLWRVSGDIYGKAFVLNCRFVPQGAQLGGICTDVATGDGSKKAGKKHELSAGRVSGNTVTWSYPVKVMFISVDINLDRKSTRLNSSH